MNPPAFDEVERQVIFHYARSDYEAALATLDRFAPQLSSQWERLVYWRACLFARLGHTQAAIETLGQAVEAGAWWAPKLLETESDFDPLWAHGAYRELLGVMHERALRWDPPATGLYVRASGGMAVPGPPWPQSGLRSGRSQHDRLTRRRLGYRHSGVSSAGRVGRPRVGRRRDDSEPGPVGSRLPVAGTPLRARRVLPGRQALSADRPLLRWPNRGVLVVAPMLRRAREIAEVIEWVGPPPWPVVVFVAGSDDPAAEGTRSIATHLQEEGVEVTVQVDEGAGHEWLQAPPELLTKRAVTTT